MKWIVITVLVFFFLVPTEADQQCISCDGNGCLQSSPKTSSCNGKCFTLLLRDDSPNYEKNPFIVKGCTKDYTFYGRSCVNKCYDDKKEFGSSEYYMCVYCCTGDECNKVTPGVGSASQMYGTLFSTVLSAALSIILIYHDQG